PSPAKETALAAFLRRHANDVVAMDAALTGMRGSESAVLDKLLEGAAAQTPDQETAITMVAASIIRSGQDAGVQSTLALITAATRPAWQRAAVLRGAEVA